MIKDVTQVFFDPQRKALRIISKKEIDGVL